MATSKTKVEDEIGRDHWREFLDQFSKRNQLRPTRLEVVDSEIGDYEEEEFLPFIGVSFEPKGSEAGSVEIMLGGETAAESRQITHLVKNVRHIYPLIGLETVEDGLGIIDAEGSKTLLIFEELAELPE
jgi:hypothetical protein